MIIGDFNINIAEKNNTTREYYNIFSERSYKILNKTSKKSYTRKCPTNNNTILDHIITNAKDKIAKVIIISSDISDHNAIMTRLKPTEKLTPHYEYFTTTITNNNKISQDIISKNFSTINSFEELSLELKHIIEENQRKPKEECPWINEILLKQIRIRNKMHKKHKKNQSNENIKNAYVEQRTYTAKLIKNTKRQYYKKKFQAHQHNAQKMWDIIKKQINKNNKNNRI